jgi:hypothetical protein
MPLPYRQCRLGDDLSFGTRLHILPPGNPPHSLAKLIARDASGDRLFSPGP